MLTWLRCFEAAARHGSFTQGATELFLSQAAVSQQVKELEERLGVQLFERLPRKLVLTTAGEQLSKVVTGAFNELEYVLNDVEGKRTEGELRLSCYSSFALLWLMPRLGGFFRQQPGIALQVLAEFHALEKLTLQRERIDAAIRYDPGHYPDLEARVVLDEILLPVASPAFLEVNPGLKTPADLEGVTLLHDATAWSGAAEAAEWSVWFKAVDAPVNLVSAGRKFNLSQLAVTAAVAGEGVAMGRAALILDHLRDGRLKTVFPTAVRSPAAYRLVHVKNPHPCVAALGGWLTNACAAFATERDQILATLVQIHEGEARQCVNAET